jgi:hypothetical protein
LFILKKQVYYYPEVIMKRIVPFFIVLCATTALFAQEAAVTTTTQLDGVVKDIARNLNVRLLSAEAQKISVGQFVFQDRIVPLGNYWNTQLTQELASLPARRWLLLSGPAADADYVISGEIVEIVNAVRVYTRLIRTSDRSINSSAQSDFNRDAFIAELLAGGGPSPVVRDAWEPDSMANPVPVPLGEDSSFPVMNRTIHASTDEDFFLLVPDKDGLMTCETTGDMDTYMYLYDESGRQLAENDDGGSGNNARIRQSVRAGGRYIAKVKGYGGEAGSYGFRAYLTPEVRAEPDEYEPDDTFEQAKDIVIGVPQQHTFHSDDDVDWVKFQITSAGDYTIRARGVNSNRLDTCIELFDSNQRSIGDDDDGGDNLDSMLSLRLDPGTYYLKVRCLESSPGQPCLISVTAE